MTVGIEAPRLKALTVKNPWAWAIINAGKNVENRSQPTSHRGTLYIHIAKRDDEAGHENEAIRQARAEASQAVRNHLQLQGYVLGTVEVVGCHHSSDCKTKDGYCSEWARPGFYHWELSQPRPLACPFPEVGKLNIWNLEATS
ncbi:ASCH domain-containing protein [Paenarthrobacter sp. YJN-5]|uniref:ASCH domain-containing protein n=1 Tax=Paenarthrobacter sp. YJN-5 TaxID=2735316 RepID=UPI001877993F|nr:ASCH domain-containing protein [Paenarthrobacter sp. YJN-5]QOT16500.1 ASCH domain-containing protein [Paenarthrobacter sp. YJN-5]